MFRLQQEDVELITHESGGDAAPDETAPAPGTTGPAPELVASQRRASPTMPNQAACSSVPGPANTPKKWSKNQPNWSRLNTTAPAPTQARRRFDRHRTSVTSAVVATSAPTPTNQNVSAIA